MLNYLPKFIADLREMGQIIKSEAPEFEKGLTNVNDLLDQNFVSTATWGLDKWERIAYISTEPGATLEERRLRIINHLSSSQPATHKLLESIINNNLSVETARVRLDKTKPYHVNISFDWEDFDWQVLLEQLKASIPAHLGFTIHPKDSAEIEITHKAMINFREYHRVREMYIGMPLTKSIREVTL